MRWVVYNGSPRGPKSNTHVMLEGVREGMTVIGALEWDEVFLHRTRHHQDAVDRIDGANGVMFGYPLYTDSMPAVMVQFLEILCADPAAISAIRSREIPAAFLVHSGFPDGVHTAHLEDVHKRLCEATGLRYVGTIRKPGSEGVRLMPPKMQKRLFSTLRNAGSLLVNGGTIDPVMRDALARYERPGVFRQAALRVASAVGVTKIYWNQMLKQHNAREKRFDAPYGQKYQA
jgi:hypothetical protein